MEKWLIVFVGLTAVAVVLQAAVLTAICLQLRRTNVRIEDLRQRYGDRLDSLLNRADDILKTLQTNSHLISADLAAITQSARDQAQKFDRLTDEFTDRARLQIIRLDELIAQALRAIEEAGSSLNRSLTAPVREAAAVIQGVKTALDYLAHRQRPAKSGERTSAGEQMFI